MGFLCCRVYGFGIADRSLQGFVDCEEFDFSHHGTDMCLQIMRFDCCGMFIGAPQKPLTIRNFLERGGSFSVLGLLRFSCLCFVSEMITAVPTRCPNQIMSSSALLRGSSYALLLTLHTPKLNPEHSTP